MMMLSGEPAYYCPACKILHRVNVNNPNARNGSRWTWNGDAVRPTFSPTIVFMFDSLPYCKSTVTAGRIYYHKESLHDMAGESIPLQPIPIEEMGY